MTTAQKLTHRFIEYLSTRWLRRVEIRYRLIGSLILVSLLPLLISGYIEYTESSKAIEDKTRILSSEVVKQVSKNVKLRIDQIDAQIAEISLSNSVQQALVQFSAGGEDARSAARHDLTDQLLKHFGAVGYINQKYFLDTDNKIIDTQVFAQLTQGVASFVSQANVPLGRSYWGEYDNRFGMPNLGMLRRVVNPSNNKTVGSIFLAIRSEHFSAIFDNVDLGSGAEIYIIDASNGKIIVWPKSKSPSTLDEANGKSLATLTAEFAQHGQFNGFVNFESASHEQYRAAFAAVPGTSWMVVNTIPKRVLNAEVQSVRNKMIVIGLLCFMISLAIAVVISSSISVPLADLMSKLHETSNLAGQFSRHKRLLVRGHKTGTDELSRLSRSFTAMNDAVNQKIREISEINASLEQKVRERTAALAAREQESRTLIENSPDTIARYDLDCRRIYVNPVFGALVEGGVPALLGKTPREVPGGPNAEIYMTKIKEVIATGENVQFELHWPGKDGRDICSHVRLTAERDEHGKILSVLGVGRDITELHQSRSELNQVNVQLGDMNVLLKTLATSDPLTQLPNRRLLLERMESALASSLRTGLKGVIMFIDLDNFKTLNDTLGHDVGDALLKQVARRLVSCVRAGDTVARMGGDEFVVMLEGLSESLSDAALQTELIGEKLLKALTQVYILGTHEYDITASMGVTIFGDAVQTTDELMKQADIAMYQSKRSGRNTLSFFDVQMQKNVTDRADMERELRRALEQHQFRLHYQVQVGDPENTGRLEAVGAEALIRWMHPEQGIIYPDKFISLAEENGLILEIGAWVIDHACAQLKLWETSPLTKSLFLAINVSAKQFVQADFVDQVKASIQRHAIDASRLKLEITESVFLTNVDDIIAKMNAIHQIGVQFSLDDFGTGYSSLQYLKRLPLDQLKIDRSFVRDIAVDSSDEAIVRTIIAMAESLNLSVVAEGVETDEQRRLLLDINCFHYQGYLFGRPVPIQQFETMLAQHHSLDIPELMSDIASK